MTQGLTLRPSEAYTNQGATGFVRNEHINQAGSGSEAWGGV